MNNKESKNKFSHNSLFVILDSEGQSLVDILIGIVLLVISINAALVLVFGGQSALTSRENAAQARVIAGEGLHAANFILKENWSGTADGVYGLVFSTSTGRWLLSGSEDTQSIFTRKITIQSQNSNEKTVSSTVVWAYNPLKLENVELVTLLTNAAEVFEGGQGGGGDTGGGGTSGDWQNPRTLGSVDLGPGEEATDLDVINKIVYMTAESSAAAKADFFIVNAANGEEPVVVSSINTTDRGLTAVDAAGAYAYAANNTDDDDKHLQIIDVSDISAPLVVSEYTLPGTPEKAISIFYANSRVYIGTEKNSGREFHVVDVADVQNPARIGSFEFNEDVNGIYVSGNIAYVASNHSSELKILDVSDPADIVELGNYDAPGNSEDGQSVYLVGSTLYLGRTKGSNHTNHHELHILDISSSSPPQNLGSKDFAYDLNDLKVRGSLAFLATNDPNKEFQAWDISDPESITPWSSFNFSQVATGIDYEDNIVYVSVRSNDALRIITSSP